MKSAYMTMYALAYIRTPCTRITEPWTYEGKVIKFSFSGGGLPYEEGGNYLVGDSYPSAYYDATKLEQRPQIFAKLSFTELCSLKLSSLHLF